MATLKCYVDMSLKLKVQKNSKEVLEGLEKVRLDPQFAVARD